MERRNNNLGGTVVKNLLPMWETEIWSLDWKRKWQPTPVSLLRKIPWKEEPGRLQSMGSQKVGHKWLTNCTKFWWSLADGTTLLLKWSRLTLLVITDVDSLYPFISGDVKDMSVSYCSTKPIIMASSWEYIRQNQMELASMSKSWERKSTEA